MDVGESADSSALISATGLRSFESTKLIVYRTHSAPTRMTPNLDIHFPEFIKTPLLSMLNLQTFKQGIAFRIILQPRVLGFYPAFYKRSE